MRETEQYQFKLIEGSDQFLPDPINENTEKIETILADLQRKAKGRLQVIFGSYQGTGEYGKENPNRLDLPIKPLMILIMDRDNIYYGGYPWFYGMNQGVGYGGGSINYPIGVRLTWGDRWVSWYGDTSYNQLNFERDTYLYMLLGCE